MPKTTLTTTEVLAPFDDAAEGRALTTAFQEAVSGMGRVLVFGARLWKIRENVSARGHIQEYRGGRDTKGDGLKAWLAKHAPEVTRSTAYRFLGITEEIAKDYQQIVGVRVAKQFALPDLVTTPAESLPKEAREKQLSLFDYVQGTSQRSWLDRFKPLAPRGGRPGDPAPKKTPKTPAQQRAEMENRCNLLGEAVQAIIKKRDYVVLTAPQLDGLTDLLTQLSAEVATWRNTPLAQRETQLAAAE